MQAKDVMSAEPVTVTTGNSIWHAAQIMLERDVSGLPVVDDNGEIAGIFTEGDLLDRIEIGAASDVADKEKRIRAYSKGHAWCVADVMTSDVVTAKEDTPLSQIAVLMKQHKIKRVPVLRGRRLVGIVSRKDLLRVMTAPVSASIASGDEALQRSLLARLGEQSDLATADLDVVVTNGIAHVRGIVDSEDQRNLVRVIAESIRGVEGVRNELKIAGRGAARPPKP